MITLCRSYLGTVMQVTPSAGIANGDQATLQYALNNYAHLLDISIQGITHDGTDWIAAIQAAYDCVNNQQNTEVIRVLTKYAQGTYGQTDPSPNPPTARNPIQP